MVYEVVWTEKAIHDFEQIIHYLEDNYSASIAEDFANKLLQKIALLEVNPLMYVQISEGKNVRRCVVVKQCALYYSVEKDKVTLLTLFEYKAKHLKTEFIITYALPL